MSNFKYLEMADRLKAKILEGAYQPGERIPIEPELSKMFSTGRHTVRRAVALLEEQGLLHRIQGSGTYVAENLNQLLFPEQSPRQSDTVGLVTMDDRSYIFSDIMHGACNYFTSQGYLLNVFITDGNYDSEKKALDILLKSRPAGILLEPTNSGLVSVNFGLYQQLAERIPCLLLHTADTGACPALPINDRQGARKLTDYLIQLGHTKIGTFFCFEESTSQRRYCGYLDSLRSHGLTQNADAALWTLRGRVNDCFAPSGSLALNRMLQSVTAVFCHDDRIAYALIHHLRKNGIRVPDDISVVGYDDSFYATLDLPITTVTHPKTQYGILAAQALLEMIHSSEPVDLYRYTVEPELVVRDSASAPAQIIETAALLDSS